MFKKIPVYASLIILICSCSKNAFIPSDDGCAERVNIKVTDHLLDPALVASMDNLLRKNGIDPANLRYMGYVHDTTYPIYTPQNYWDHKNLRGDQYTNGLHIMNEYFLFNFRNDTLYANNNYFSKGTNLDTVPHLNPHQLRFLFMRDIEKYNHWGVQYKDSCFKAEFGYLNTNDHPSGVENLIKAWKITPLHIDFPQAFYRDDNGGLYVYNDGFVSVR